MEIEKNTKIEGWLFVYLILLGISLISSLGGLFSLFFGLSIVLKNSNQIVSLGSIFLDFAMILLPLIFGILSFVLILKRKKSAIISSIIYLGILILTNLVSIFQHNSLGKGLTSILSIPSLVISILFILYFLKSQKIRSILIK